jgi:ABC-type nitrate/sulfonate/bicarbonate transport system substrate-binding protein
MKLLMPLILLLLFALPGVCMAGASPARGEEDLSRHPVYSRYNLTTDPKVINFATQPLAVPIGVIAEVMRRDRLLRMELAKMGYEIRFHPFLKGDDINFFFGQGKIAVAMGGDMPTIMAAASLDIVVTALAKQGFSSIVASNIATVADLKGKRIGYPPFSNAHYTLLSALSSVKLKETDVQLIPMDINRMVDALASHKIDAFVAWEPVPSVATKTGSSFRTIYRHQNSSYFYLSRAFADRHPEAASQMLAAMIRALHWMKKDERNLRQASAWMLDAGGRLQGKQIGLTADEIAVLTRRNILDITTQPTIPELDLTDRGTVRRKLDFLKNSGIVPVATATEKVLRSFDREMISRILTRPNKYRLESFDYETERVAQ